MHTLRTLIILAFSAQMAHGQAEPFDLEIKGTALVVDTMYYDKAKRSLIKEGPEDSLMIPYRIAIDLDSQIIAIDFDETPFSQLTGEDRFRKLKVMDVLKLFSQELNIDATKEYGYSKLQLLKMQALRKSMEDELSQEKLEFSRFSIGHAGNTGEAKLQVSNKEYLVILHLTEYQITYSSSWTSGNFFNQKLNLDDVGALELTEQSITFPDGKKRTVIERDISKKEAKYRTDDGFLIIVPFTTLDTMEVTIKSGYNKDSGTYSKVAKYNVVNKG